jgi:hypothetical protein
VGSAIGGNVQLIGSPEQITEQFVRLHKVEPQLLGAPGAVRRTANGSALGADSVRVQLGEQDAFGL